LKEVIGAQEAALTTTFGGNDETGVGATNDEMTEKFFEQLSRADDGFSVIAEYFGRGVFNKVTLVSDDNPAQSKPNTKYQQPVAPVSAFGADPSRPAAEGRLRGEEVATAREFLRPGGEGRLRGHEGRSIYSSAVHDAPAEARLRRGEAPGAVPVSSQSEGRVRKVEAANVGPIAGTAEGRTRTGELGVKGSPMRNAPEARLRLHEGEQFQNQLL
jgi:hypothetical protein